MANDGEQDIDLDAHEPPELATKAVEEGAKSANLALPVVSVLSILAGLFIALGGLFFTTVLAGTEGSLPYGLGQFLAGLVFTVGLVLVLAGGAELFTGNTMSIAVAWYERQVTVGRMLGSWGVVFVGNFVGSLVLVGLVFLSGQYTLGGGEVGAAALTTAEAKVQLSFLEALTSGILANFLVCLAVWLSYSARTTTDKIVALVLPIWAFVAAGLEHSVANMYLVPMGLVIKDGASGDFWASIGAAPSAFADLTWGSFLLNNLLPVTIGNIVGGAVLVGLAYWYAFRRA